jgi:hypothetical protein
MSIGHPANLSGTRYISMGITVVQVPEIRGIAGFPVAEQQFLVRIILFICLKKYQFDDY